MKRKLKLSVTGNKTRTERPDDELWNAISFVRHIYWQLKDNDLRPIRTYLDTLPNEVKWYLMHWKPSISFDDLPEETIWMILNYLKRANDFWHGLFVCKRWRRIIQNRVSDIPPKIIKKMGLRIYQYFPNLVKLTVTSEVTIDDLCDVFQQCTSLKALDLSCVQIIDDDPTVTVQPLSSLTCLEKLAISTWDSFRVPCSQLFQRSTTLTDLSINVTDGYPKTLVGYWLETAGYWTIKPKKFEMTGSINQVAFSYVNTLHSIESLKVDSTGLHESEISQVLWHLTTLSHLSLLKHSIPLSDSFLVSSPSLNSFEFQTLSTRDSPLNYLNNLTCLTKLSLDMDIITFTDMSPMPTVIELSLKEREPSIFDYSVLTQLMPNLTRFTLCTLWTNCDGIILPVLEKLEYFACNQIDRDMDLMPYFPNLKEKKILVLRSSEYTPPRTPTSTVGSWDNSNNWI